MTMIDAGAVFPRIGLYKLYLQATSDPWKADHVVDWRALELERLAAPIRRAMSAMYTDVVFAEVLGLSLVERILARAPEAYMRAFARAQVVDELRHIDFFSRVVSRLGEPLPVGGALLELERELAPVRDHEELMVHLQIMELSAQAVFIANTRRSLRALKGAVRLPATTAVKALLHSIIHNVGRDETRHVAFGIRYLRERLPAGEAGRRSALLRRAARSAALMQQAFSERSDVFRRFGIPPDALARSFTSFEHQLGALGIDAPAPACGGDDGR